MDFNLINVVEKPWGREIHFALEGEYVGKILEVKGGQRLSLQYHKRKKETMYLIKGRIRLTLGDEVEELGVGKSVTLAPGVTHRVEALEDSQIIEVSTNHLEDVVRLEDDHGRHISSKSATRRQ
ncbi:MAG: cupin domain-containing protein [Candidatus Altiarchaeota archaeon]